MNELEAMHDLREEFRSSLDVVARELMKQKYELCVNTDDATQGIASMYQKFSALETIAVKLQSRLESLEKEMQEQARIIGMGAERELALVAKVESLGKDAARYRWLRDETQWEPFDESWLCRVDIYGEGGKEMDSYIDTAIQANKGE